MLRVAADGLQDGRRSGSIHHQGSALHHFTEVAIDDGCHYGLVCGDITHGTKRMYRGIEMDLSPDARYQHPYVAPNRRCALHKSYRGQKGAEDATKDWLTDAVTEDEVKFITMRQWGHVHYKDLFWHGPMTVMNPGCFESQNIYLAEKALTPEIGALISHTRLSESGWACEARLRWLHYCVVEDDYSPG